MYRYDYCKIYGVNLQGSDSHRYEKREYEDTIMKSKVDKTISRLEA